MFNTYSNNMLPSAVTYTECDPCTWFGGVLGVVKHQHVWGGGLGGDDAGVLGHIAGTVDLSFMADLDFNLNLAAYWAKASKLCREVSL